MNVQANENRHHAGRLVRALLCLCLTGAGLSAVGCGPEEPPAERAERMKFGGMDEATKAQVEDAIRKAGVQGDIIAIREYGESNMYLVTMGSPVNPKTGKAVPAPPRKYQVSKTDWSVTGGGE